ncbi:DUF4244 domain-containing protein [Cryobacterium sp. Hh7]|uniref:DUF4244 domain-containing protein n=1 Tax=Cryobacterium sp. Hh7 TaxID=1259159 RepID=UPI001F546245|nr:DUF4244 domain-containing protein [Cryobacterium sp. Hh7]
MYTKIGLVEKAVPVAVVSADVVLAETVPEESAANTVLPARSALRRLADEAGAATAEYVVATMAAVGFAGLLIVILRSDEVRGMLTDLVRRALSLG